MRISRLCGLTLLLASTALAGCSPTGSSGSGGSGGGLTTGLYTASYATAGNERVAIALADTGDKLEARSAAVRRTYGTPDDTNSLDQPTTRQQLKQAMAKLGVNHQFDIENLLNSISPPIRNG